MLFLKPCLGSRAEVIYIYIYGNVHLISDSPIHIPTGGKLGSQETVKCSFGPNVNNLSTDRCHMALDWVGAGSHPPPEKKPQTWQSLTFYKGLASCSATAAKNNNAFRRRGVPFHFCILELCCLARQFPRVAHVRSHVTWTPGSCVITVTNVCFEKCPQQL